MTHANEFVLGIRDELRNAGLMVSECVVVEDDPAGDFGIAWYYGIDRSTSCARMSYDVGYLPSRHTVVHEFGHDFHAKWQYAGVFEGFWSLVFGGFSPETAAHESNIQADAYQAWRRRPSEVIADLFAWAYLGDFVQTEMWGIPLTQELRSRLMSYFRSFKEETESVTPQQMDELKAHLSQEVAQMEARLKERIALAETNVLREVMGGLLAGFNVTVPTHLNRLASGDKNVLTAEKEV